ncbi:MAG: MFS transporter [Proteobacteria bacterium]|nr:MFS transporter [Pseudomonadota bacterium]NOG59549.1 MFS transporter [Pseudomonadota bacterium]
MSHSRPVIFYGWYNVLTSFLGMALCYAMFTVFAFGTFVKPLETEFGWQRGELSFALTMTNIAVVITSPLLGFVIDRIGVRRVLIPSIILMGLTVLSMTLLSGNIWHFYVMYFLIPFLGAGTLPQSFSRVIIGWFTRRRGLALGIALSGFGVGAALIPSFAQIMIDNYGWRTAYAGFAIAIFCISLPVTLLLLKETPEELNLQPDGENNIQTISTITNDYSAGLSSHDAAKTKTYWLILMSFFLVGIGITSILAHLVPMLIDRGVAPTTAAFCMTSLGIGLIFGRILAGYLMDQYFAPYIAAIFLLGLFIGIIILALGTSGVLVFLAAVFVGLATGSEISEIAYICSRYFGQKAFGQIYGTMFAAFQLGSAFGAPLMGVYYDRVGNYIGALWLVAGLVFFGITLMLLLGPYPDSRNVST